MHVNMMDLGVGGGGEGGMVFCQRDGGIEHLLQHFLTTLHTRDGREGCWCVCRSALFPHSIIWGQLFVLACKGGMLWVQLCSYQTGRVSFRGVGGGICPPPPLEIRLALFLLKR